MADESPAARSLTPSSSSSPSAFVVLSTPGSRPTPPEVVSAPFPEFVTANCCVEYRAASRAITSAGYGTGGGSPVASLPSVMLSPNATNRVAPRTGITSTVTLNVHMSVRCRASVATHVVVVLPTENDEPLGGVHTTDTGAAPPVAVASG